MENVSIVLNWLWFRETICKGSFVDGQSEMNEKNRQMEKRKEKRNGSRRKMLNLPYLHRNQN